MFVAFIPLLTGAATTLPALVRSFPVSPVLLLAAAGLWYLTVAAVMYLGESRPRLPEHAHA